MAAVVAATAVVLAAGCDDEDLESVPTADVDAPALAGSIPAPGDDIAPFGTIAVDDEVYSLGGFVTDAGDFDECTIDPPDRPGYISIDARVGADRVFTFNVLDDVATVALGAVSEADVDYEVNGSSVRGNALFDEVEPVDTAIRNEDPIDVEIAFDITCE